MTTAMALNLKRGPANAERATHYTARQAEVRTLPGAPVVKVDWEEWARRNRAKKQRAEDGGQRADNLRMQKEARDYGAKLAGPRGGLAYEPQGRLIPEVRLQWSSDFEEVPEVELERDPELPPSRVRLEDHARGEQWCREQVAYWQGAGFLPRAVSRLVGLRLVDVRRLGGGQRTEGGRQRTEDGGRMAEASDYCTDFRYQTNPKFKLKRKIA